MQQFFGYYGEECETWDTTFYHGIITELREYAHDKRQDFVKKWVTSFFLFFAMHNLPQKIRKV